LGTVLIRYSESYKLITGIFLVVLKVTDQRRWEVCPRSLGVLKMGFLSSADFIEFRIKAFQFYHPLDLVHSLMIPSLREVVLSREP
jgi:hypothetical protein